MAMHLAETESERELLDHQTGPFVDLLKDFGVWESYSFKPETSLADYLKILARAPRSLVIHGNYLSNDEIELIAAVAGRMSVVYCPRTHHYFGHQHYPLERFLQAGVCVAVGTDSRASNPDLDLFEELKFIANSFPQIAKSEILQMGTINGAKALGVHHCLGSISNGNRAAISCVQISAAASDQDPLEWIFADEATCSPLW